MLATSFLEAQWLERLTGVRKVMGSIPFGDSDFSLSHARDILNNPSFLISSPSLKFTIFLHLTQNKTYSEVNGLSSSRLDVHNK